MSDQRTVDEVASAHREELSEWIRVGRPPLCPCCGGYRTTVGDWEELPSCAESPLSCPEICGPRVWAYDMCPRCERRQG